jgi:hypothetical protein
MIWIYLVIGGIGVSFLTLIIWFLLGDHNTSWLSLLGLAMIFLKGLEMRRG